MLHDPSTRPGEYLYIKKEKPDDGRESGFANKNRLKETLALDLTQNESPPSWNDFTQSTTFHGVRYIFQRNHFKVRR